MWHGKCLEYNLGDDTSLITRDERFQEFMVSHTQLFLEITKKQRLIN
jgi:hypothetical protein